jgi:hypothetical protein
MHSTENHVIRDITKPFSASHHVTPWKRITSLTIAWHKS